jgi:flavorubredoxin
MSGIKVSDCIYYVGGNDYQAELFENLFPIPKGMAYNSYLINDEKTVLLDTIERPCPENNREAVNAPFSKDFYKADRKVSDRFLEEVKETLNGRKLDYLVVDHMEPDHSASIGRILDAFPETKIIITALGEKMLEEYVFNLNKANIIIASPALRIDTGRHLLRFIPAPFVHWPEVMMTYDEKGQILFSADAFGSFGADEGSIFSDELQINEEYYGEMRRYYTNIVGKFGSFVLKALGGLKDVPLKMICPLHGPIWRNHFADILSRYTKWASFEPEDPHGFMVVIGSIYGHTAFAASELSKYLEGGKYFDVAKTNVSYLVSEAFRVKTIVLASVSYAGELYPPMNAFLTDIKNIGLQNRTFALIENGTWAPVAACRMKGILALTRNNTILDPVLTIHGSLKPEQEKDIKDFAEKIKESLK